MNTADRCQIDRLWTRSKPCWQLTMGLAKLTCPVRSPPGELGIAAPAAAAKALAAGALTARSPMAAAA